MTFIDELRELHLPHSTLTMSSTQYASAIHVLIEKRQWAEAHSMLNEAELAMERRRRQHALPIEAVEMWLVFDGDMSQQACTALYYLAENGIETIGDFWNSRLYEGLKADKLTAKTVRMTLQKIAEYQEKYPPTVVTQTRNAG